MYENLLKYLSQSTDKKYLKPPMYVYLKQVDG